MIRGQWSGRALSIVLGVLVAVGAHAQQPPSPASGTERGSVEQPVKRLPEAISLLKATSNRLAAARSMRFSAMASYENPSRFGQPLVYTTQSEVLLQRPDKLRVITPGDGTFVQVWIGTDDKLPRMARAVYCNDPAQLRHQVEFSNWQLDTAVLAGAFASPKAATATRIPFARPDAELAAPDISTAAQGEPSQTC